jgi:hypothetical protein
VEAAPQDRERDQFGLEGSAAGLGDVDEDECVVGEGEVGDAGAVLRPLEELGRPRIDVVMTLSGIFRDLLPLQTRMLAEAAWLATVADEPEEMNFVKKHSLAHQAKHGCDLETAALRVFSNAEGAYGANVNMMIDSGNWTGLTVTDAGQMVEEVYVVQDGPPNFGEHCTAQALEWVPQADIWHENPIMIDNERTFDGKLWKSLMDYNVWAPPIGWREVVAVGYPAWVQPTGAHDAYKLGDRVSFNGADYESRIAANVWSPSVYPAGWLLIA